MKDAIKELIRKHVEKRLMTKRDSYEKQAEERVKGVMDCVGDNIDELTASYLEKSPAPTLLGWERYNKLNNGRITSPSKGTPTKKSGVPLTSKEKFILSILEEHAYHDGTCSIRVKELIEKSGYCKRTVIRSTELLADKGFIEKIRTGRQNTYRILQKRS